MKRFYHNKIALTARKFLTKLTPLHPAAEDIFARRRLVFLGAAENF